MVLILPVEEHVNLQEGTGGYYAASRAAAAPPVSGKYKSSCCVHHTHVNLHHPKKALQSLILSRVGSKRKNLGKVRLLLALQSCVWLAGTASSQPGSCPWAPGLYFSLLGSQNSTRSSRLSSPCLARACARGPGPSLCSTLLTQKGGRPRDLNTPGSSSLVCWVMAAANIDWRNRKGDCSQAEGQGRCGKARKALTYKRSKAQVWRRSNFQGPGSFLKRSRLSQRGVGRSTINSQASFSWADKQVRDGGRSRVKIFKKKTERVQPPDLQDVFKFRKTCQQQQKFGHGEVRRSTINSQGGSSFRGNYRRQSRNSRFRNAPPLPVECSVCQLKLSGSAGLKEHVRGSPICDLRNFILIKRCYVKIARSHVELLSANKGGGCGESGNLDEALGEVELVGGLDHGGGYISKQLYMEALGLDLRGSIMDDNLDEESTRPCYAQLHQCDSVSEVVKVWERPDSGTISPLSSSWNLSWNALSTIDIPSKFFLRSLSACILNPKPSR